MKNQQDEILDLSLLQSYLENSPDLSERERELFREAQQRLQAQADLVSFASSIEIPDAPSNPEDPDHENYRLVRADLGSHHKLWLQSIQKMFDEKLRAPDRSICRRIMGLWPPGSGKSLYTSVVTPAYCLGKWPSYKVMLTSYSDELPSAHGRRVRQICNSAQFKRTFGFTLREDSTARDNFLLTNQSEYYGAGILGGLTGKRADLLITDDLTKNREDADSLVIRDKTWNEYLSSAKSRKKPGAFEIAIGTRWHWDDVLGRILPEEYGGESGFIKGRDLNWWFVVCLPMIAEHKDDPLGRQEGEILWPEFFRMEEIPEKRVDTRMWNSLYQQRPSDELGTFFKKEWFKPYDTMPDFTGWKIYGMSDYAVSTKQTADYTVHAIIGMDPQHQIWLLDLWRKQADVMEWLAAQLSMMSTWKPLVWLEPSEVIQKGAMSTRDKMMRDYRVFCAMEEHPNTGDKMTRARSLQAYMYMFGLHVPRGATWFGKFEKEMMSFPSGKNDDQVDAISLFGRILDRALPGRAPPPAPPESKLISTNAVDCTVTLEDLFVANDNQTKRRATNKMYRIA